MAKLLEYIIFAETVETPMGVIHTHGYAVFDRSPACEMAASDDFDAEYDRRFEEARL